MPPAPATSPAERLKPCPRTPNCVATGSGGRPGQRMEPIPYTNGAAARARLRAILRELPRTRVVEDDLDGSGYLHAEVRSALFRFVDDVELAFDDGRGQLHFRSASRLGRSDFGVNRRRMEAIRRAIEAGAAAG
ncbi:MAG TPA: DUF1499 domain-containing protein [Solirubrobacterales bacterium]|nr:DUF1499 domain-containing protein [Solirubrobacterales bacterium]